MLLAVDKPQGITSFDVIRALKKVFPPKTKIGHSGTLDPMATGLLLVGVYEGTKLLHGLQGLHKTYETTIDFSKMSDTRDLDYWENYEEYEVIGKREQGRGERDEGQGTSIKKDGNEVFAPSLAMIQEQLKTLIPSRLLPLTPFSAKKINGQKMYDLARRGEIIQETREMRVDSYEILSYDFPLLRFHLAVGSGTYIRSIGYWLGQQFGLGGILTQLRRASIGSYNLATMTLDKQVNDILYAEISPEV